MPPSVLRPLRTCQSRRRRMAGWTWAALLFLGAAANAASAAEAPPDGSMDAVRELFDRGRYAECIAAAAKAVEDGAPGEDFHVLKLRAELATGAHAEAIATFEAAVEERPVSIALLWYGRLAFLFGGEEERAAEFLEEIGTLLKRVPRFYGDPENRVLIGRYLLERGADPRAVLEQIYDPLKKEHPEFGGAYIASGELALGKQDYAVAAQELGKALKIAPGDPEVLLGLARALAESDPAGAEKNLRAALERNPNHVGSLLHLVDGAIDREAYDEAATLIARVLGVHAAQPSALAYRAVLAHLSGDHKAEAEARAAALRGWPKNPDVDHVIGRKLSQKYRFAEGAASQRRAIALDRNHLPSKLALCQDLLRLGREEEGWRLAQEVYEKDGYNVVAHNLNVLREHLKGFRSLEAPGLILRMDAREAAIYGEHVLELLVEAREALCARYEVELREPIVVEIFPEQKDFAIRTFGLPGGSGFLGVCFGSVITANSPASQGRRPANWRAVLWHELCHAVTLHKTRNRMPRWLSEGISVYEERRANPAWGQAMTPQYLDLIEGGGIVPVGGLSGAFLQPPTPAHLEFAYYQASLVVECLIERHGFDALKGILSDLAEGLPIHVALERRTGSLEELERQVEAHVRARAAELASKADWAKLQVSDDADLEALAAWNREHPDSFWGLERQAACLISKERWAEAKAPLERLLALCPEYVGPRNAYEPLAKVHRQISEPDAEMRVLRRLAELDAAAADACLRLLGFYEAAGDWAGLRWSAERLLAVDPLLKAPHRSLIRAAHELGTPARAVGSYRALLAMDPTDPADLHLGLARLLRSQGKLEDAKRQLLEALEEAPRFREAHRELLAVVHEMEGRRTGEGAGTAPGVKAPGNTPLRGEAPRHKAPDGTTALEKAPGERAPDGKAHPKEQP